MVKIAGLGFYLQLEAASRSVKEAFFLFVE